MSASYRYDQMKSMGTTNAGWGVCGFTGALYAMYNENPGARQMLINAPRPFTVLAEIKTYLVMLQADSNIGMLNDIEGYTRTFPGFENFTVRGYIQYINESVATYVNANDQVDDQIFRDAGFSIAMPPQAVADYLQRMWGKTCSVQTTDCVGDAIVGVRKMSVDNSGKPYNGLCHWVYRKSARIFSWGKFFVSLKDANPDYELCYTVKIVG